MELGMEWTKCSDSLPELHKEVLVWNSVNKQWSRDRMVISLKGNKTWFQNALYTITYWMEIEPPKP